MFFKAECGEYKLRRVLGERHCTSSMICRQRAS